jgi:hypothetical protein
LLTLELLGDFDFPDDLVDENDTVGDAFEWFLARSSHGPPESLAS